MTVEKVEDIKNLKKIKKNERIKGREYSHVILYSDDYDELDNSIFNTKMCTLTFWTGAMYFPGGILNKNISLEDNVIDYVQKQLNFDIEKYRQNITHLSSHSYEINGSLYSNHTYTLKITPNEMASLMLNEKRYDENGNKTDAYEVVVDNCGINKFNVSLGTLNIVLNSNFEPIQKLNCLRFVDKYIDKKMQQEKLWLQKNKEDMELAYIEEQIMNDRDKIYNEIKSMLEASNLNYLLDPSDPRHKDVVDQDGLLKNDVLDKIFLSDDSLFDISAPKKKVSVLKPDFSMSTSDFTQKW